VSAIVGSQVVEGLLPAFLFSGRLGSTRGLLANGRFWGFFFFFVVVVFDFVAWFPDAVVREKIWVPPGRLPSAVGLLSPGTGGCGAHGCFKRRKESETNEEMGTGRRVRATDAGC
jgi:hypothetical protein